MNTMVTKELIAGNNTERLRIAFLVNDFPAPSETFILDQIIGLTDLGQDVDIYANQQNNGPHHADIERYKLMERVHFMRRQVTKGQKLLKAVPIALNTAIQQPAALWEALGDGHGWSGLLARLDMLKYFESLDKTGVPYDIIHCHYGTVGRQYLLLKRALPAKFIVSFYGFDLFCYGNRGNMTYRQIFKKADRITANSDYTIKHLIALGCPTEKIVKLRIGLNTDMFPFRPRTLESRSTVKLLSVARLVAIKGLEYAIEAIAKLTPHYPIQYEIVGEGPERPNLESLIHQLGLSGTVFLLGARDREEVSQLMNKAHLFLLPSITSSRGQQDSGPGVLKEAQASGMPVVASNSGGIPESLKDGKSGFLVPERDVDALADKLEFLINHPERWPEMGRAGRRLVEERFDIKEMKKNLVQIYHDTLNR